MVVLDEHRADHVRGPLHNLLGLGQQQAPRIKTPSFREQEQSGKHAIDCNQTCHGVLTTRHQGIAGNTASTGLFTSATTSPAAHERRLATHACTASHQHTHLLRHGVALDLDLALGQPLRQIAAQVRQRDARVRARALMCIPTAWATQTPRGEVQNPQSTQDGLRVVVIVRGTQNRRVKTGSRD